MATDRGTESASVDQMAFEWRLDNEADDTEIKRHVDALERLGGDVHVRPRPLGVLPLAIPAIIFGVVVGVGLFEQVVEWWTNRKRRGLLIHISQTGKLDVREIDIPYGQVLFVGRDGKALQYTDVSADRLKDLLAAAGQGLKPEGGAPTEAHGPKSAQST